MRNVMNVQLYLWKCQLCANGQTFVTEEQNNLIIEQIV